MPHTVPNERTRWLSVIAIAIGAFIFNTTEFIPIALLSSIGSDFALAPTETGIMITAYAWLVALTSLPLMLLTRRIERRKLLLSLFAVFILGHIASALADSFAALLASRIAVSLAHAVFWAITAALIIRVAPKGKSNQALGWLGTGTVLAMVFGVPLGKLIGTHYGWRSSFLMIALLAALTAAILYKTLPHLPSHNSGSLKSLPALFKRPTLVMLFGFTVLMITAHFTAYSYIEPYSAELARLSPEQLTLLLSVYGAAGFLGSYCFGKLFGQHPKTFFIANSFSLTAAMLLLHSSTASPLLMHALALAWGAGIIAVGLSMQSRVIHLAGDATDVANSILSTLYNVGIGGGALLGQTIAQNHGLTAVGYSGGLLALAALLLACLIVRRRDYC